MDEGGPLREFFHLLIAEVARKNMLFCDVDGKRIPRRCVMELQKQTYCLIGKIIAFSLIQLGQLWIILFMAKPHQDRQMFPSNI